jgi:hypothetical protein
METNKKSRKATKRSTGDDKKSPRSLAVADKGIHTGGDFAKLMSCLMSDLISGRITPNVGNATCNAGGKLLKVVEMEFKYGTRGPGTGKKTLLLAVGGVEDTPGPVLTEGEN